MWRNTPFKKHFEITHFQTAQGNYYLLILCERKLYKRMWFLPSFWDKNCRYWSQCPFLEIGRCRYFHRVQQLWSGIFKNRSTSKAHEPKTFFLLCHLWNRFCGRPMLTSHGILYPLMFMFIKPARSAGFSRSKKIPYQAPPTQLGPRKCTF